MYERYHNHRTKHVIVGIIFAAIFFAFGWQASDNGWLTFNDPIDEDQLVLADSVDLSLFWLIWDEVANKYVNEEMVDENAMVYGAIGGMMDALDDPYTVFMNPDESEQFAASLDGTLEGIGAELTVEDDGLTIVSPLRDSPAEKAGLLPGDIIYKVDGNLTNEMTLFDAIMNIRGEKETLVTLTIIRDGVGDPFDVSIVRDSIDLESVSSEVLDGDIKYISVNQFSDDTIEEFNREISELILDEPEGLIIDLRYNGGGYLDIAVDMLSFVLPSESEAVMLKERSSEDDVLYTNGNAKLLNVPLVVLVNEGSASASEIVAGAIQDHERGVVMGTQTFGKGTVQEVESFSDGSSIRITIAKWFTPDGRSINKQGITPDIIVELTDADLENAYDRQLEEAARYLREL